MHIPIIDDFTVKKLEAMDLSVAIRLCDKFVGKGMYSEEFFRKILLMDNHYFYLVYNKEEVIGYFYYSVITPNDLTELTGLESSVVQELCKNQEAVGVCRSIGVEEEHRGTKLSDHLLQFFSGNLFEMNGVSTVFIPAWVKGNYIPAKRLLMDNNYSYLCMLDKPWINNTQLVCPYCRKKHCICDAVLYYMKEKTYYENKKAICT